MLLKIKHMTVFAYQFPVPYALQRLRLQPMEMHGQKIIDWKIEVEGQTPRLHYIDGFGNHTHLSEIHHQAHKIQINAAGTVDIDDTAGIVGKSIETAALELFLRSTALTQAGTHIDALIGSLSAHHNQLDLMHEAMDHIHKAVRYQSGTTDAATTAEEALARGQGVCQDHAHIFVSLARCLNIPARYVSGYLMMEGVSEQTATHAWAEAYIDGLGWVGFDAANNVCPDWRYIRLATGLDYRDCAPVLGIRHGGMREDLNVHINVEQQ